MERSCFQSESWLYEVLTSLSSSLTSLRTPIVVGGRERTQVEFHSSPLRDEYNDKVEDNEAILKLLEVREILESQTHNFIRILSLLLMVLLML